MIFEISFANVIVCVKNFETKTKSEFTIFQKFSFLNYCFLNLNHFSLFWRIKISQTRRVEILNSKSLITIIENKNKRMYVIWNVNFLYCRVFFREIVDRIVQIFSIVLTRSIDKTFSQSFNFRDIVIERLTLIITKNLY